MRWHSRFLLTFFGALAVLLAPATLRAQSATDPAPREGNWLKMHESFLDRARQGEIDLLFLGDSITQGWNGFDSKTEQGPRQVWERHYGPRNAANFGIGGDRTQHVLWRIQNGEINNIDPKVVVLMIGTNNLATNPPEEIAKGVTAIVETLRQELPESKLLLLGVFHRGLTRDREKEYDTTDPRIEQVNERIAPLGDLERVTYLDLGEHFLAEDGTIPREVMPDFLHLSRKGYRLWAEAMEPTLWELLDED
ncbi:hypothetical protein BH23PLA1_BH23PLA1_22660 [soil metagenome]